MSLPLPVGELRDPHAQFRSTATNLPANFQGPLVEIHRLCLPAETKTA